MTPFNVANADELPALKQPAPIQNNVIALWHLDTILPDFSTPDATGKNPIVFSPIPYMPNVVPGMFGQAMNFSFFPYGMAFASPSLDLSGDFTIDSWIKVTSFENSTYNNILVESTDTLNPNPSRLWGLAINGLSPANATSGPLGGSLRLRLHGQRLQRNRNHNLSSPTGSVDTYRFHSQPQRRNAHLRKRRRATSHGYQWLTEPNRQHKNGNRTLLRRRLLRIHR